MRKECTLVALDGPTSRCTGSPYAVDCGVSIENASDYSLTGGVLVPGRLLVNTTKATFVK